MKSEEIAVCKLSIPGAPKNSTLKNFVIFTMIESYYIKLYTLYVVTPSFRHAEYQVRISSLLLKSKSKSSITSPRLETSQCNQPMRNSISKVGTYWNGPKNG